MDVTEKQGKPGKTQNVCMEKGDQIRKQGIISIELAFLYLFFVIFFCQFVWFFEWPTGL